MTNNTNKLINCVTSLSYTKFVILLVTQINMLIVIKTVVVIHVYYAIL